MKTCKYCNETLKQTDWAMAAKGKEEYACINCSEKALEDFGKKR